jgi:mannose-1-phosphate guanylyltransferase/mannose-6-phosphate isomerase
VRNKKKTSTSVNPVILSGGSGYRLWPLSRSSFPKQFHKLSGSNTLFQQALERVNNLYLPNFTLGDTLIITGEKHRFLVLDQLVNLPTIASKIILEPESKNTAPALTLAALQAIKDEGDSVLVVTPADQTIKDLKVFEATLQNAIKLADQGEIVVLGVTPTSPQTGFGYIKHNFTLGVFGEFEVNQFIEKPDIESAQNYISSGGYFWNSGMIIVRASIWIKALSLFRKDILNSTDLAFSQSTIDHKFIRPNPQIFSEISSESIDYAVLEKCPNSEFKIKVIPLEVGWNDLGSWDAVWQSGDKDKNGNLIAGDVFTENSTNNLIYSNSRLIGVVGVNNLVIVETADALIVTDRNESKNIKKIINNLSDSAREEHLTHRKVFRPWGWYDTIDVSERFKVKRIQVNPGAKLSLQKHSKRAEHWIVVKGMAEVICGEKLVILKENESTFIPLGEKHRLSNPFSEPLEIIEIQSGSYLGEDDIVRFDDDYGRNL